MSARVLLLDYIQLFLCIFSISLNTYFTFFAMNYPWKSSCLQCKVTRISSLHLQAFKSNWKKKRDWIKKTNITIHNILSQTPWEQTFNGWSYIQTINHAHDHCSHGKVDMWLENWQYMVLPAGEGWYAIFGEFTQLWARPLCWYAF